MVAKSPRSVAQKFQLFVGQVGELRKRRMFATGLPQLTLRIGIGKSGTTEITGVDDEEFRALMITFRPFTADREDVYFPSIANLLHLRLTDENLKEVNASNRAGWKQAFEGMGEYVLVNTKTNESKRYLSKDFYNLLVNGKMFHLDNDKAAEFDALPNTYKLHADFCVKELVIECSMVLHNTANIIRAAQEKGQIDTT